MLCASHWMCNGCLCENCVHVVCTNAHHINLTNERFQYYFFIAFNQTTLMEWLMSCNQSQTVDCENYKLRKTTKRISIVYYPNKIKRFACFTHTHTHKRTNKHTPHIIIKPILYLCIHLIRFSLKPVQLIHIKFPKQKLIIVDKLSIFFSP